MIKTTIKHTIVAERIISSTKKTTLLGIVIYQKTHHYPDLEEFEILLSKL